MVKETNKCKALLLGHSGYALGKDAKGTNPLNNQQERRVEKTSLTIGLKVTPHVRDKKSTQSYSVLIQVSIMQHATGHMRLQAGRANSTPRLDERRQEWRKA